MNGGFLLDTSILSLFALGRTGLPETTMSQLRAREASVYICAVTPMEIEQGIAKLLRSDDGKPRAEALERWLVATLEEFASRLLPFDVTCARAAGRLSDHAMAIGRHPGFADIAIAATAGVHDMVLVTRNTKHFEKLGITYFDPFEPR